MPTVDLQAKFSQDLFSAARRGEAFAIPTLVEKGADIHWTDSEGRTPLHVAGHKGVVLALLALGADIWALDRRGRTPLHVVAQSKHTEVAEILIMREAMGVWAMDRYGRTPLHLAAMSHNPDMVAPLVHSGAEVDAREHRDGYTPLHFAARYGDAEAVSTLLTLNADVYARAFSGATPLHCAVESGRVRNVERFKLIGNFTGLNAFDHLGDTPLHTAVKTGASTIVKLLLTWGAAVDPSDKSGWTPLHWAVAQSPSAPDVVALLLKHGASVNAPDSIGNTPLHVAVTGGNIDAVRHFFATPGVDINAKTKDGITPMHRAIEGGDLEIIELLATQKQIGINATDAEGFSPLHIAVLMKFEAAIKLLLEHGASPTAVHEKVPTPLNLARQLRGRTLGYREICKLLKESATREATSAKPLLDSPTVTSQPTTPNLTSNQRGTPGAFISESVSIASSSTPPSPRSSIPGPQSNVSNNTRHPSGPGVAR